MSENINKIIVCVSGGMVQAVRSNFLTPQNVEVIVWDEDAPDYLAEEFELADDSKDTIENHWDNNIPKTYPNVIF